MVSKSLSALLAAALYARTALSVDIAFTDGQDCTGTGLYGTKSIPHLPCFDLSILDPASSVHMHNLTEGQVLHFYADQSCQEVLHTTADTEDECFSFPSGQVNSFSVHSADSSEEHKRDAVTTAIAPYSVKMTDLTAMGPYDVKSIQLSKSTIALAAAALATGHALLIYASVNACTALTHNDNIGPQDIFNCAVIPIAMVIGWTERYLVRTGVARAAGYVDNTLGQVNTAKRSVDIDQANADYMHSMFNGTSEGNPSFLGFVERNMSTGTHTSPMYEINSGNGRFHITSHYEQEDGDFVYHLRDAADTPIDKRDAPVPFGDLRWGRGGYDFRFCAYNTHAGRGGYEKSLEDLYNVAYDQLKCYDTNVDIINQHGLGVDLYNTDDVIVGEVVLEPYTNLRHTPKACQNTAYGYNSVCVIT